MQQNSNCSGKAFSFDFENLKSICDNGEERVSEVIPINTDSIISRKIKNREALELNDLPKTILVEILKHLNDKYSSCIGQSRPQNPFFHNYCYTDQIPTDQKKKQKKSRDSNKSSDQQLPQYIENQNQILNQNQNLNSSSNNNNVKYNNNNNDNSLIEFNSCIYINDIINLSLVCKYWAKYIVPFSISSFIKISNKKEMTLFQKYMTMGIIEGGNPLTISTVKFYNSMKSINGCSSIRDFDGGPTSPLCRSNPIRAQDYTNLLESCEGQIKSICVGSGVLSLPDITAISHYIRDHSNLQEVRINTNLCPLGFQQLFTALKSNRSISSLDISNNPMSREAVLDMVDMLLVNQTLTYLDLSFNSIGMNGNLLTEAIKVNTTLQSFFLMGNQLDNESIEAITDVLKHKNQSITEISLSENQFEDEIGLLVGQMFLSNKSIKSIDLSINYLNEATVQGFTEALLCPYSSLTSLNLSDCNMSEAEEYGIQFFKSLQTNQTLKTLVLWSCDLNTHRLTDSLAQALKSNTGLTEISLGYNEFNSDNISVLVQKGLKFNKTLKIVSLSNNSISTVGGIIIAEYLKANHSLRQLSLFDNCLENSVAIEMMNSLCVNHDIKKLCLGSNKVCPNLTTIFRKLLQYNRSIPSESSYNNSRQQWIQAKLNFLKSELLRVDIKWDKQTQLSTSVRELFKVLNVHCPPTQNQQALTQLQNAFLNNMFLMNQCKISSSGTPSPTNSSPISNNSPLTLSPQPKSSTPPSVYNPSASSPIPPLVLKAPATVYNPNGPSPTCKTTTTTNNYLWQSQGAAPSYSTPVPSTSSSPGLNIVSPPSNTAAFIQPSSFGNPNNLVLGQKPNIFSNQQPSFPYNNGIAMQNQQNSPQQLYNQPQQLFQSNLSSPNQFQPYFMQQPTQVNQQQQSTIPNIYTNQQRITRQFEDELMQLQNQLQLDINNNSFTGNPNNTPFNTFF